MTHSSSAVILFLQACSYFLCRSTNRFCSSLVSLFSSILVNLSDLIVYNQLFNSPIYFFNLFSCSLNMSSYELNSFFKSYFSLSYLAINDFLGIFILTKLLQFKDSYCFVNSSDNMSNYSFISTFTSSFLLYKFIYSII